MTRAEFNNTLLETFGKTPAQWVVYPSGTEWDGTLFKRSEIYGYAKNGVKYRIWPYVGYKQSINVSNGNPIELTIKPNE